MSKGKTKRTGSTRKSTKKAARTSKETKAKAKKPAADKKPKRTSALDAAATVLKSADKPMRAQELIAAMAEQGLWTSPAGKTPHATLYTAWTMLPKVA